MKDLSFSSGGIKFDYLVTYPEKTKLIPFPKRIILPLKQDESPSLTPLVKKNSQIKEGDLIAKGVNSCLVSPIRGRVSQIIKGFKTHFGEICEAIEIEIEDEKFSFTNWEKEDFHGVLSQIFKAGIIDNQGKVLSLFSKIEISKKNRVKTIIINGLEEIISHGKNYFFLEKRLHYVKEGIKTITDIFEPEEIIFALYNDYKKIDDILSLNKLPNTKLIFFKKKYPQHTPPILIRTIFREDIPVNKAVEESVKTTILNLDTIYILGAIKLGIIPYREKIITVVKGDITETELVETCIGTPIKHIISALKISPHNIAKVVINGVFSGQAIASLDYPVTKDIETIFITYKGQVNKYSDEVCLKCGLCVNVCPMNLMPLFLYGYSQTNALDFLEKFSIQNCIECGCCTYVCPVNIPIVQWIKYGKTNLLKQKE